MGGGVGLSVHAPFRIATERTLFAMPETSIGFFPDVGTSFFLPRLDGYVGIYLALTSNRLNGVNAYYTGIATHYIDSSNLPALTARLAELEFEDSQSGVQRFPVINATIEEFSSGIPYNEPMLIAGELRRAIDRCFRHESVEQILEALDNEQKGDLAEWAFQTKQTLLKRCPFSLKLTLKQMHMGKLQTLAETFERDYSIASHFMTRQDFASGVYARLIDKPPTTPKWDPPTLEEVEEHDVNRYFRREGQQRLGLIDNIVSPLLTGLPPESKVKEAFDETVEPGDARDTRDRIVAKMIRQRRGKSGVKEKVEEVLDRKCRVGNRGELVWIRDQ